ncbi:MAG: glycoside hydrolase family 10 protein [Halanaerobium sp.]
MKKIKKYLTLILLLFLLVLFSINSAAYFKTDHPRSSLLKIRDAERALREAESAHKNIEEEFRLVDRENIAETMKKLETRYEEMTNAYQLIDDELTVTRADEVIEISKKVKLMTLETKPVQFRAFWLDSRTLSQTKDRKDIAEFLDRVKESNFNAIIPEVFFKGLSIIPDNNYFKQDPRFKSWKEDPLQVLIEEAHKRGIEVHAWVWVFNENTHGEKGRLLKENPDWANKDKDGNIVTYHNSSWLSPSRPDVRRYLQKRYQYLAENYNLDGINLDYIRFPEEYRGSFGFDEYTIKLFSEKTGFDRVDIENNNEAQNEWNKFREELITEMVKETSAILRKENPDILISADVIPGINEARYRAMQNWKLWLDEEYLDFVLPMTYTTNLFSELQNWVKNDRSALDKPIYPGISVFKLSQQQLLSQIVEIDKINPNGLSLFAAAHLTEQDFKVLKDGYFKGEAVLAHQDKEKAVNLIKEMIYERIEFIQSSGEIDSHTASVINDYLEDFDKKYSLSLIENYLKENNQQARNIEFIIKDDFNNYLQKRGFLISDKVLEILIADLVYLYDLFNLY